MKIALIDSLALTYSAKYAIPKLYANDEETGIIYGFMRYILALQKKFDFDQFIFTFDSRHSKRSNLYRDYKMNRNNAPLRNMVYNQVRLLEKTILPQIGFKNLFKINGIEADDIIASLCKTKNPDDEYYIISRDQDLYQLLDKNISQYDYISKKLITFESFQEKYGIDPKDWGMVKAISGCKSDNVLGIERIGEKSACKYLNDTLKKLSKAYQKIESNEGQEIIKRNKTLVILPFYNTPKFKIIRDELKFESLINVFIRFEFNSMLTNQAIKQWRERFSWIDIKRNPTLNDYW